MAWSDYDDDVSMAVMYGPPAMESSARAQMAGLGAVPWWYLPGIGIPGIPFLGFGDVRAILNVVGRSHTLVPALRARPRLGFGLRPGPGDATATVTPADRDALARGSGGTYVPPGSEGAAPPPAPTPPVYDLVGGGGAPMPGLAPGGEAPPAPVSPAPEPELAEPSWLLRLWQSHRTSVLVGSALVAAGLAYWLGTRKKNHSRNRRRGV